MSTMITDSANYTAIADAIREKNGETTTYKPSEMAAKIKAIEGGSGSGEYFSDEDFTFTGSLETYTLAAPLGNKIITNDQYRFKFTNISQATFLLNGVTVDCDFDIYMSPTSTLQAIFQHYHGYKPPRLHGDVSESTSMTYLQYPFAYCYYIRDWGPYLDITFGEDQRIGHYYMFAGNYSLRIVPKIFYQMTTQTMSSAYVYSGAFVNCYALDELLDVPVYNGTAMTSNMITSVVGNCYRLKGFTFESGRTAQWKGQTIDLTTCIGYGNGNMTDSYILNYNSGITADKKVTDDASYQALKDDPDWYTSLVAYSRYNHDSALETIKSLPDTSEYLATAGGTNTIRFNGKSGSATDGGAINTLTDEEIQIATDKGWTVTIS